MEFRGRNVKNMRENRQYAVNSLYPPRYRQTPPAPPGRRDCSADGALGRGTTPSPQTLTPDNPRTSRDNRLRKTEICNLGLFLAEAVSLEFFSLSTVFMTLFSSYIYKIPHKIPPSVENPQRAVLSDLSSARTPPRLLVR